MGEKIRSPRFFYLPILIIFSGVFAFVAYKQFVPENSFSFENDKIIAPDGEAEDFFGDSVAIFGNTLVVGSVGTDDNGTNSGSAYVFVKKDKDWTLQQKLTPLSDRQAFSFFGSSVDISEDTIIVGAGLYDNPVFNEGAAYIFVKKDDKWIQQQKLVPSDPKIAFGFGNSVALEGNNAIIGAPGGAAYIFGRSGATLDRTSETNRLRQSLW